MHFHALRTAACQLAALLALAVPVQAEDDSGTGASPSDKPWTITQTMNLYGDTLVFPPPAWVTPGAKDGGLSQTEISRQQEGNQFIFEMVPKAEGFDRWTQLYGVAAMQSPDISEDNFEKQLDNNFGTGCARVVKHQLDGVSNGRVITYFCESYSNDAAHGEIGVFRILKEADVTVKVYHEWRGAAFAFDDEAGWPVKKDAITAMAAKLTDELSLSPPP